jgi:hypothetical protein
VILALLAVTGYIFMAHIMPNLNKPEATVAPTEEVVQVTEPVETAEPTFPCENLILEESEVLLTEYQQKWLINVEVQPLNTTDKLTFISSDELIARMNKPVGRYRLAEIVEALKAFDGEFILQTMFLRSKEFDTTEQKALDAWMNIVRELRPREIMVYTIDRETPDKSLEKYTVEEMTDLVQPLLDEGFKIQIRG